MNVNELISAQILNSTVIQLGNLGCNSHVEAIPIHLAPQPMQIHINNNLDAPPSLLPVPIQKGDRNKVFIRLWFPLLNSNEGRRFSEILLSGLSYIKEGFTYEILGNNKGIIHHLVIPENYLLPVLNTLKGLPKNIEASYNDVNLVKLYSADNCLEFRLFDVYRKGPFFRNIPDLDKDFGNPLSAVYETISMVEEGLAGLQILIQPASDDWRRTISQLLVMEKSLSQFVNLNDYGYAYASDESNNKLDLSKKLFFFRMRAFLFTPKGSCTDLENCFRASLNINLGTRMNILTEKHYIKKIDDILKAKEMLCKYFSYAYGCIVNQRELANICTFPTEEIYNTKKIDRLIGFKIPPGLTNNGIIIGKGIYAGESPNLTFPGSFRSTHCEVVGLIRTGKSTLLKTAIKEDILSGHGLCLIYPHEQDLIDDIINTAFEKRKDDLIFITHCLDGFTVAYNHFNKPYLTNYGKAADDLTHNIKSLHPLHWGANMDYIFRNLGYALNVLPNSNLIDATALLDYDNTEGDELRHILISFLKKLDNPEPARFWIHDLKKFQNDLKPIFNKFGEIFLDDNIARAFAYRGKPKFDINDAMDASKIIVIYEPVGLLGQAGDFDASLYISDFYHAAMSRIHAKSIKPFYLYIDEMHRYTTRSLGDIFRECAKFGLYITFANQQRNQLSEQIQKEIGNVGNLIAFQTNFEDARSIERESAGKINANDLLTLGKYNFWAKLGDEYYVRGRTIPPERASNHHTQEAIQYCLKKYYVPDDQIYFKWAKTEDTIPASKKRIYDTF